MNAPLPFTRENVLSWAANVLTGAIVGLMLCALAYLFAGGW
jgi:hypothetical protein